MGRVSVSLEVFSAEFLVEELAEVLPSCRISQQFLEAERPPLDSPRRHVLPVISAPISKTRPLGKTLTGYTGVQLSPFHHFRLQVRKNVKKCAYLNATETAEIITKYWKI